MDNIRKYSHFSRIANIIIIVALIMACSNNGTETQGGIDKHAGTWITKNNVDYSYRISINAKNEIAQSVDAKNETWRKTKESVLIFYIADLDSAFSSIGKHEINLEENGQDMQITENGITYKMSFEYYKGIFFPKDVHKLSNKE